MGQPIIDSMGNHVGTWDYIGSQGPFYTKSETDQTFVPQTRTVNNKALSTNISLDYSDVGALPDSTVIGNGTVTIQKNSTTIDSFTLNQTADKTIDISVPTKTSDLTNDGDGTSVFTTSSDVSTAISTHNTDENAHSYIQGLISDEVTARGNADTALDGRLTTVENNYVPKTRKINGYALSSDIDLTYEDVGAVGLPETLNDQEFLYRQTPASQDGVGRIDSIKGNTIKFNQLGNVSISGSPNNGITWTDNNDGSITVGGTLTDSSINAAVAISTSTDRKLNHIYLILGGTTKAKIYSNASGNTYSFAKSNFDSGQGIIFKVTNSVGNAALASQVTAGTASFSNEKIIPQFFDLTDIFGDTEAQSIWNMENTTEGTGVLYFKNWLSSHVGNLPYYAYDPGSLISFNGTGLKSVGFNQCDEEYEEGVWQLWNGGNGGKQSNSDYVRSKNYIRVMPNTEYCFYRDFLTADNMIGLYDADKKYLGFGEAFGFGSGSTIIYHTIPSNACYITFYFKKDGFGKLCINISDTNKNGTYETYKSSTLTLPISTYFPTGMKDLPNGTCDTLTESNATVKVGRIIIDGTQGTFSSPNTNQFNIDNLITDYKKSEGNITYESDRYVAVSQTGSNGDFQTLVSNISKAFNFSSSSANVFAIRIKDTDYSSINDFKTYLSNNPIVIDYELATYTETPISPSLELTYDVQVGGTEQILPENTSTPTTSPIIADITYSMFDLDVGKGILTIQKNSSSIGTFSANANNNTTINIPVPTQLSDLSDTYYTEAEIDTLWANTTI